MLISIVISCRKTEEAVKSNIEQAQKKQKEYYDLKHGAAACFNVGSVVLKKDFTRKKRKGGKLDYWWQGPYMITASLGKGLFKLKELNGDKVEIYIDCTFRGIFILPFPVVQQVNGFHLKRYLGRMQCLRVTEKLRWLSKCSAGPHFILHGPNRGVHSSSPHWAWPLGDSVNSRVQRRRN